MHGKGSVGKSTFASFVTAQATKREMRVFLMCSEEDPLLHRRRAEHMGADPDYIFWPDPLKMNVCDIKFPTNIKDLEAIVETLGIGFVYIDSIKTHGDVNTFKNMHDGDKSRKLVEGIAAIGIKHRIPILGTFHNNKGSDTAMGSEELANTARQQLSLTSVMVKEEKRLSIEVDKSNGPDQGKIVQFKWNAQVYQDKVTGEFQKEIFRDDIDDDNYREGYAEEKDQQIAYLTVVPKSQQVKAPSAPVRDATAKAILEVLEIGGEWMASNVLKTQVMEITGASKATVERSITSLVEDNDIKTEGNASATQYKHIRKYYS